MMHPITADWRECPQCGLLSSLPDHASDLIVICPRCRHRLARNRRQPFEFTLCCALAAALFYVLALWAPFLEISAYGRFQLGSLDTGPLQLMLQGYNLLGLLVLAATIVLPGLKLFILLTTLLGIETRWLPPRLLKTLFRWYGPITPWAMIDVYLLGFLVAYTRMAAIASVHLDTALYALIGLMLAMAATDASLDAEAVWRALDQESGDQESGSKDSAPAPGRLPLRSLPDHAIGCHVCGMVNLAAPGDPCCRCDTALRVRTPDSINRAWAFTAAAAMLYIPANLYPVMIFTKLANAVPYTIFGGIEELVAAGLWPLALLVLFASLCIPLFKLFTLAILLVQTQTASPRHLLSRTTAYRILEFIGRWSMIDVFVISLLVALVRFGQFTNVRAEAGAPCFAAVVVLTMIAAHYFDPRLMWDAAQPTQAAPTQAAQAAGA